LGACADIIKYFYDVFTKAIPKASSPSSDTKALPIITLVDAYLKNINNTKFYLLQ